jgi:hypothetical protein
MQIRSLPFWLMMVSMAMAVLPVWRSPMISSRWPRPMGIIESMALMPVWTGVSTLLRHDHVGRDALDRPEAVALDGPLAVDGLAQGVDHPADQASPTGTDTMRPVLRTTSPSSMSVYSPMMMMPTSAPLASQ